MIVEIPWHDGTWREVEYKTRILLTDDRIVYAVENGYKQVPDSITIYKWAKFPDKVVAVLTEAPEPPVKVTVPTGLGAIIRRGECGDSWSGNGIFTFPLVRANDCWVDGDADLIGPSFVLDALRNGAVVVHEGVTLDD